MRRLILIVSLICAPAYAVINGIPFDWNDHDNLTGGGCTGTLISGDKLITARHCQWDSHIAEFPLDAASIIGLNDNELFDVSISILERKVKASSFTPLSNNIKIGEDLKLLSIGSNQPESAIFTIEKLDNLLMKPKVGDTEKGDSGSPLVNSKGELVAIHNGHRGDMTAGVQINQIKQYILDNVNSWHYPTVAKFTGNKPITVQSLHINDVADSAYTDGDVTIIGGTCLGKTNIKPFDTCTYEIQSNGGEGHLYLTPNENILINEQVQTTPEPQPDTGSKSGGSFSYLGLLSLFCLSAMRRKNNCS